MRIRCHVCEMRTSSSPGLRVQLVSKICLSVSRYWPRYHNGSGEVILSLCSESLSPSNLSSFQSALSIVTQKYHAGAPLPWFEIDKTPMLRRKTPLEGRKCEEKLCRNADPVWARHVVRRQLPSLQCSTSSNRRELMACMMHFTPLDYLPPRTAHQGLSHVRVP
jgi:hypothetical protein